MDQAATTTENVKPSELAIGDIVRVHGLRLKLETGGERAFEDDADPVFSYLGVVLNPEVVAPGGKNHDYFRGLIRKDERGRYVWAVQGNDGLTWVREV